MEFKIGGNDKLYLPLILNINPSEKLTIILEKNYYGENYANGYLLEFCKLNGKQCEYTGVNKTATFEKDEKYKIRYNCYGYSSFSFISFSSINIFEMEIDNIHLFELGSKKDQYFITNVKNYENFYIYFNSYDSEDVYTKFISENEMETIDKNIKKYYFDRKNFWENILLYERTNDYLIIKVEYKSFRSNEGSLGVFSKIYNIEPNKIIEIDKGTKALIQCSTQGSSYFLLSSCENMKSLEDYKSANDDFKDFLELYYSLKTKLYYVNSTNEKTKLKFFKIDLPYGNVYYNDLVKSYLEKYGPDSLFMRIFSQSSSLMLKIF